MSNSERSKIEFSNIENVRLYTKMYMFILFLNAIDVRDSSLTLWIFQFLDMPSVVSYS